MTGDLDPEERWWQTATNAQLRLAAWFIILGIFVQAFLLVLRFLLSVWGIPGASYNPAPLFPPLFFLAIYVFVLFTLMGLLNDRLHVRTANKALWVLLACCPLHCLLLGLSSLRSFPPAELPLPLASLAFGAGALVEIVWWLAELALSIALLRSRSRFYGLLKPICYTQIAAVFGPILALIPLLLVFFPFFPTGIITPTAIITLRIACCGLILAPKSLLALAFFRAAREDEARRMQGLGPGLENGNSRVSES